jgi:hypothetical protein
LKLVDSSHLRARQPICEPTDLIVFAAIAKSLFGLSSMNAGLMQFGVDNAGSRCTAGRRVDFEQLSASLQLTLRHLNSNAVSELKIAIPNAHGESVKESS